MKAFQTLLLVPLLTLGLLACSSKDSGDDGATDGDGTGTAQGPLSWHKDISPLLQANCQGCHVEGGIGPFPLTDYSVVVAMKEGIKSAVSTGQMPPWMPSGSDDCAKLADVRKLSTADVEKIVKWIDEGTLEGDPEDAPTPVTKQEGLSTVSAELKPSAVYAPNAQLADDYRCFILDPQLSTPRDVVALEVVPGVRAQVHHVILFQSTFAEAQAKDEAEPGLGWTCFGSAGTETQNMVGGWVPGTSVVRYPEGTGVRLPAGSALILQVHYNLAQGSAPDLTTVKLQYSDTPVAKPATIQPIADLDFVIPPNSSDVTASETFELPRFYALPFKKVWGVIPHMHTRGKRVVVRQNDKCLIDIPKWDFHWQQTYLFDTKEGLPVEGGDKLTIECTWDNPTPKEVKWGEGTDDEMCVNFFYLTP